MTSAAQLLLEHARLLRDGGAVLSPCISVCRMNGEGVCEGCFRTLDEIAGWSSMDEGEKRQVWQQLEQRARKP